MAFTLIHVLKYFLGLEPAASQTTEAERVAVGRYLAGRKRLVEIGVFEGVTTAAIARGMDQGAVLYAIDPFFPGRLGVCWGKLIAIPEVQCARSRGRVVFLPKFSYEALSDVPGEVDFVFIDGDHSLEGITRDWTDWSARIEVGGIIALHDTCVSIHHPNTAQLGSFAYFESHIRHDPRFVLMEQVESLSILQRKSA